MTCLLRKELCCLQRADRMSFLVWEQSESVGEYKTAVTGRVRPHFSARAARYIRFIRPTRNPTPDPTGDDTPPTASGISRRPRVGDVGSTSTLRRLDRRIRHRPLLRRAKPGAFLHSRCPRATRTRDPRDADPPHAIPSRPFICSGSSSSSRRPKTAIPKLAPKCPGCVPRLRLRRGSLYRNDSKGRCGRSILQSRVVVLRSEDDTQLQKMREAFKDDLEYIERDITLHAFDARNPTIRAARDVNNVNNIASSSPVSGDWIASASAALLSMESTTHAGTTPAPAFTSTSSTPASTPTTSSTPTGSAPASTLSTHLRRRARRLQRPRHALRRHRAGIHVRRRPRGDPPRRSRPQLRRIRCLVRRHRGDAMGRG